MIALLVIGLAAFLVMGLTRALPPAISVLFLVLDAWALGFQLRTRAVLRRRLTKRKTQLSAQTATILRHLGGLPLPVETPVGAYFRPGELVLEADGFRAGITPELDPAWCILSRESLSGLSDRLDHPPEDPCGIRILSEVRERFRRNDRSIRVNRVLMLQFSSPRCGRVTAIFLTRLKPAAIRCAVDTIPAAPLPSVDILTIKEQNRT